MLEGKKAEVIPFQPKGLIEFRERFEKDLVKRVAEKQAKVRAYPDWKWDVGDRVHSPKTGNIYEITGKSWHTRQDKPFYLYKNVSGDLKESGGLFADIAERDLILLGGPKGLAP